MKQASDLASTNTKPDRAITAKIDTNKWIKFDLSRFVNNSEMPTYGPFPTTQRKTIEK
jgi:hypothetical protein